MRQHKKMPNVKVIHRQFNTTKVRSWTVINKVILYPQDMLQNKPPFRVTKSTKLFFKRLDCKILPPVIKADPILAFNCSSDEICPRYTSGQNWYIYIIKTKLSASKAQTPPKFVCKSSLWLPKEIRFLAKSKHKALLKPLSASQRKWALKNLRVTIDCTVYLIFSMHIHWRDLWTSGKYRLAHH